MAVSPKHVLEQGPVLWALGRAVARAALSRRKPPGAAPAVPGPEVRAVLPPRPADLVRDYVRHVGGDPASYRDAVPAHLFPQWSFPLVAEAMLGIPYPMARVLNSGCRIEMRAPLPAAEPLEVSARLESIDDDGRRALLRTRIVTGTRSAAEAVVADLYAYVPLAKGKDGRRERRERPRVPEDARELAFWRLGRWAGLEFAVLTGDFNPVHWVPPYARAFGFPNTILHGFATLARAVEGLNRTLLAGAVRRLALVDVRFSRPLVLPARVGLYVSGHRVFVGDAPGGGAYLEGTFGLRDGGEVAHG